MDERIHTQARTAELGEDDAERMNAVGEALELANLVAAGTGAEKHFEGVTLRVLQEGEFKEEGAVEKIAEKLGEVETVEAKAGAPPATGWRRAAESRAPGGEPAGRGRQQWGSARSTARTKRCGTGGRADRGAS